MVQGRVLVGAQVAQGTGHFQQSRPHRLFERAADAPLKTLRKHSQAFREPSHLPVVFPECVTESGVQAFAQNAFFCGHEWHQARDQIVDQGLEPWSGDTERNYSEVPSDLLQGVEDPLGRGRQPLQVGNRRRNGLVKDMAAGLEGAA
jgi:hypothetical protein